jgi:hypothetical protein
MKKTVIKMQHAGVKCECLLGHLVTNWVLRSIPAFVSGTWQCMGTFTNVHAAYITNTLKHLAYPLKIPNLCTLFAIPALINSYQW